MVGGPAEVGEPPCMGLEAADTVGVGVGAGTGGGGYATSAQLIYVHFLARLKLLDHR